MKNNLGCVILNYNDYERTIKLANNLSKFELLSNIVIVDNCSSDSSFHMLKKLINNSKIDVIQSEKNGGFAFGTNIGIKYLLSNYGANFILCINTDIEVDEYVINELYSEMIVDEKLGIISSRLIGPDGKEQISCWKFSTFMQDCVNNLYFSRKLLKNNYFHYNFDKKMIQVDCARGSLMLLRSEAIIKCEFFDENTFLYGEETILAKKMKLFNYHIGIRTDLFYKHNHVNTFKRNYYLKSRIGMKKSKRYFMKQYLKYGRLKMLIYSIFSCIGTVEDWLINFLKNRREKNG